MTHLSKGIVAVIFTTMLVIAIGLIVVLCLGPVPPSVGCGFSIYFLLCVLVGLLDHDWGL